MSIIGTIIAITTATATIAVTAGDQNAAFVVAGFTVGFDPIPVEEDVFVTVNVVAAYLPPTPEAETL